MTCEEVSVHSIGDSKYSDDGWYEQHIFGRYYFSAIDTTGSPIYHASIEGIDWYILKDMDRDWVVMLHFYKYLTFW